jgi:hypothetical protein
MKRNFVKSGVLALLIGLSGVALGNTVNEEKNKDSITASTSNTLEVKIFSRNNGVVAVNFRKQLDETVKVKIYNFEGEMIYDEKVKSNEVISKRYNLSKLPDGYYYFEVSNGNYLVKQLVDKKN